MKAWHFIKDTLRDGSPIPDDGVPLVHNGPVTICLSGLHASVGILDALEYAPGSTICRVECRGIEEKQGDKLVCRERTILYRVDGEELLRKFTRECALDVIHLWDAPVIVIEYLKTGDPEKRAAAWDAARDAAWAAARAAAWDAARDAARAAARDAARDAARPAARDAARPAARDAAWAVARAAAWDAARAAARDAARDAARPAARDAAWAAARAAQSRRLVSMVTAEKRKQYANL